MKAFSYKNLIVIPRNSVHPFVGLLQANTGIWFRDRPLANLLPDDRMILLYNYQISADLTELDASFSDVRPEGMDATLQLSVSSSYSKVRRFTYRSKEHAAKALTLFRGFVKVTSIGTPDSPGALDKTGYYLFWSKKALTPEAGPIVASAGLLSRPAERLHHFTKKDLTDGPFPSEYVDAAPPQPHGVASSLGKGTTSNSSLVGAKKDIPGFSFGGGAATPSLVGGHQTVTPFASSKPEQGVSTFNFNPPPTTSAASSAAHSFGFGLARTPAVNTSGMPNGTTGGLFGTGRQTTPGTRHLRCSG